KTIEAFTALANPGPQYELIGRVQITVLSIALLSVQCRGTWVYNLTGDYERFLATRLAGDNPQQATAYLLHTGVIHRAIVPEPLPQDPDYIHFRVAIENPG